MNEENKYKKYVEEKLPVPNIKDRIKSKIEFKKKEGMFKMLSKKWVIGLSSGIAVAAVAGIVIGVCAFNTNKNTVDPTKKEAVAVVNMDVNPSIEFVIDGNNKVISVTGLNDEGKMMLYGEAVIGMDINDAIQLMVKVETETGYLVANASDNTISLSVSADTSEYITNMQNQIKQAAEEACAKYNVAGTVESVEKYTKEQLVELAMEYDSTLTEDEANAMSYKDLAKVISIYHLETADIYEEKLEDLYVQLRDNDIECAKFAPIQEAINGADTLYAIALKAYANVINQLQSYYDGLEDLTYSTFVNPTSSYQQALKSVNDSKDDVLNYRQQVANCDHTNQTLYNGLLASFDAATAVLNTAKATLEACEEAGEATIASYQGALQTIITTLRSVEDNLPSSISTYLNEKVGDVDTYINNAKNNAFSAFEEEYGEQLTQAKNDVAERKAKLIEEIKNA